MLIERQGRTSGLDFLLFRKSSRHVSNHTNGINNNRNESEVTASITTYSITIIEENNKILNVLHRWCCPRCVNFPKFLIWNEGLKRFVCARHLNTSARPFWSVIGTRAKDLDKKLVCGGRGAQQQSTISFRVTTKQKNKQKTEESTKYKRVGLNKLTPTIMAS